MSNENLCTQEDLCQLQLTSQITPTSQHRTRLQLRHHGAPLHINNLLNVLFSWISNFTWGLIQLCATSLFVKNTSE